MNVNKAIVAGRVVHTPEISGTKKGKPKARFSIATNKYWYNEAKEKQEKVTFHNIICYGSLVGVVEKYLDKGQVVLIIGEIDTYSYDKDGVTKYRTDIVARELQLGQRSNKDTSAGDGTSQETAEPSEAEASQLPEIDDGIDLEDIPF